MATKESFLEGGRRGVRYVHLAPHPLPSFNSATFVHWIKFEEDVSPSLWWQSSYWCVTRTGASMAALECRTSWPVCNNLVGYVHRTIWTTASKEKMIKQFPRFSEVCLRRGVSRFYSEECYFYREWRHALRVFFLRYRLASLRCGRFRERYYIGC